ncbi:uncharacterized protein BDV14DRAFT_170599 [Aspergillus stella-maris]|uniref:uncharacterized protein n=1 Tax=Aspergillus stella-maris TaxID=1810926 RepID=UPI003CCE412E
MIIYKDRVTGYAFASDEYNLTDIESVVYKLDCEWIDIPNDDYGPEKNNEEPKTVPVNKIIGRFGLTQVDLESKGAYTRQFKDHIKNACFCTARVKTSISNRAAWSSITGR